MCVCVYLCEHIVSVCVCVCANSMCGWCVCMVCMSIGLCV